MVLRALSLSFAQLGDRRILAVLAWSLLITLALVLAVGAALVTGAQWVTDRWIDTSAEDSWVVVASGVAGAIAFLLGFAALFRAIAVPVTGLFGDSVVAAVEARHYPDAAAVARPAPLSLSARLGIASFLRVVLVNLVALPAYVFLLFTAIGPLILFAVLNAVLLGRDLGEMVAVRHLDRAAARDWVRAHRWQLSLLGLVVTGLFLVPIANLLAPILGAGAATHLFHGRVR